MDIAANGVCYSLFSHILHALAINQKLFIAISNLQYIFDISLMIAGNQDEQGYLWKNHSPSNCHQYCDPDMTTFHGIELKCIEDLRNIIMSQHFILWIYLILGAHIGKQLLWCDEMCNKYPSD